MPAYRTCGPGQLNLSTSRPIPLFHTCVLGQLNVSTDRPVPLFHTCVLGQLNVSIGRPAGQRQISSPPDNWSDPDKYTQLVLLLAK